MSEQPRDVSNISFDAAGLSQPQGPEIPRLNLQFNRGKLQGSFWHQKQAENQPSNISTFQNRIGSELDLGLAKPNQLGLPPMPKAYSSIRAEIIPSSKRAFQNQQQPQAFSADRILPRKPKQMTDRQNNSILKQRPLSAAKNQLNLTSRTELSGNAPTPNIRPLKKD